MTHPTPSSDTKSSYRNTSRGIVKMRIGPLILIGVSLIAFGIVGAAIL